MTTATPARLAALRERCSGVTGGAEGESHLSVEAWHPDWVEVTASRLLDLARIIDRCGSAVLAFHDGGAVVTLRVAKRHPMTGEKVFRGIPLAFRPVDVDHAPFSGRMT